MKFSGPCGKRSDNKRGSAIAVATANPFTPPNQAAEAMPIDEITSAGKERLMSALLRALTISRTPRTMASATIEAKMTR